MATTFSDIEVPESFYSIVENMKVLTELTGHWAGETTSEEALYNAVEEGRRLNLIGPDEWSRMRMVLSLHGMEDVRA